MNKVVFSAIALSMTSTAALATDGDWSALDQEVSALTSSLNADSDSPTVFGRARVYYTSQTDGEAVGVDTGGWDLRNVRLGAKGTLAGYGYKLQTEFRSGAAVLLDAYATFGIGGSMVGTFGQFKADVARASQISSGRMLFTGRSIIGSAFSRRTGGVKLSGGLDQMGWSVSIMNGEDLLVDEMLMAGRLTATLMGSGPGKVEGAYGGNEDPSVSAAVAFVDDGEFGDATVFEVNTSTDLWSFDLAMCDAGELGSGGGLGTEIAANTSPISVQGSYMLQPGKWELGVRFQDLDNSTDPAIDSTTRMDVAINNYIDGHGLKWMINVASEEEGTNDNAEATIGLQVSF